MVSAVSDILQEQIDFYARQVSTLESMHAESAPYVETEQLIRLALAALENIRAADCDWAEEVRVRNGSHLDPGGERIGRLYGDWLAVGKRLLAIVDALARRRFQATGEDAFRRAMIDVQLTVGTKPSDIPEKVDPKTLVTLEEMRNALRAAI